MKSIMSLGKYFYAIPFIVFGRFHFTGANDMAGMLSGWPFAIKRYGIDGRCINLCQLI